MAVWTTPITKTALLNAYREELEKFPWAKEPGRLDRYMESVEATLNGDNSINRDGEAFRTACHKIGLSPRKATLKFLHALPK